MLQSDGTNLTPEISERHLLKETGRVKQRRTPQTLLCVEAHMQAHTQTHMCTHTIHTYIGYDNSQQCQVLCIRI